MARRQSLLAPRVAIAIAALAALLAGLAGVAPAAAQSNPNKKFHYTHRGMGTIVALTVWADPANEAKLAKAAAAAFAEFDRIEKSMSSWTKVGDVAAINAAAGGRAVVVDAEVFGVIERAQAMARVSGGAFDVTVGSFHGLWKFGQNRDGSIPSAAAVAERLKLVGHRHVILNKRRKTVKLRKKGQRLTLGGIAKGHAVDRAVALLHKRGFLDFILQAGGDLYASGSKSGTPWSVGIRDPRGSKDAVFALAEVENKTFSTSGDYERAVVKDGVRYHHLLDPKTGRPATGARSVTVMANDAITADIWSTALFVMGTARGLALANKTAGIEAVFVDAGNQVHATSGLVILRGKRAVVEMRKHGRNKAIAIVKEPSDGI